MTTRDYLSELPPDLADMVRAFRAEMRGACEQEAARLREALEHFKREMEIETARVKREAEIETAVLRRLIEIFKGAEPSDAIPPYLMIGGYGPVQAFALPNPFAVLLLRQLTF